MIFFGHVSPAGILELDHPELYSDLLKGRLLCRVELFEQISALSTCFSPQYLSGERQGSTKALSATSSERI
jgi:hypothetical protein